MKDNTSDDQPDDDFVEGPPVTGYGRLVKTSRRFYVLTSLVGIIVTLFIFYQTETCLELLGEMFVSQLALTEQVRSSKALRDEVTKSCKECPTISSIVPHEMFDERQRKLITKATNELLCDQDVIANFPNFDDLRFDETRAVIVPLWKLGNQLDWYQMGLTPAGVICGQNESDDPLGLTIREHPTGSDCWNKIGAQFMECPTTKNGTPQMTKDGTPRIAINSEVLNEETFTSLKYTLLHEAMHAHEVPGFKPPLSLAHSDLSYLPAYNHMMSVLKLESKWSDYVLWLFALGTFALTFRHAQLAILAENRRRSLS